MTLPATMTSNGPTTDEVNRMTGDELTAITYRGFCSHGFFRGSVRFAGDPESHVVFSYAAADANEIWEKTKTNLALCAAVKRAICAEAHIRDNQKKQETKNE